MLNPLSNPNYLIPPLLATAVSLLLLLLVLRAPNRTRERWTFGGLIIANAVWSLLIFGMRASATTDTALIWARIASIPGFTWFTLFYHFTAVLTNSRRQSTLVISYLVLFVLIVLTQTPLLIQGIRAESYGYAPIPGTLSPFASLITFFWLVAGAYQLVRRYRHSSSPQERLRLIYLMLAILFPVVGAGLDSFTNLPPMLIWGNMGFILLCTVAILRYRLLDMQIIMRASMSYIFISAVVAIPYVLALYLAYFFIGPNPMKWWAIVPIVLFLALILRPLYSVGQRIVDRVFYRDRYDHLLALQRFSSESQSILAPEELASRLVRLASSALRGTGACLLLPDANGAKLVVVSSVGMEVPRDFAINMRSLLVRWFKQEQRILSAREIQIIPALQSLNRSEQQMLAQLHADLFVPILTRDGDLAGILVMGEKSGRQTYSREDERVLSTLAGQLAITLENIRFYRESLQARQNLEVWLNSMMDYVVIADAGGDIQFMNRAAVTQFGQYVGMSHADALGRSMECFDLHYLDTNDLANMQCLEIIGSREFEVAAARLLNPNGSQSVIGVLRDVTERRYIEEERLKSSKLESISTLAGGIAHDFNNILTGILGNASLIKSNLAHQDESYTLADEVEKASNRARALTQQLLTFARGSTPLKRVVDITGLIQESVPFALRGSKARYHLELDRGLWSVNVDEGQISQVLNNILINADQAMPSGGNISINASNLPLKLKEVMPLSAGDYVRISISDEGIGIPAQYTDKIFDPYFTTKAQGTGLGLATTYSIIKNHQGHIALRSTPGEGTTFDIYLPATNWDAAPMASGETGAGISSGHVLVMDDEEMVQRTVLRMLERIGFRAEVAADGAEAVRMYREARETGDPFDLLIMDLTVPGGMGGREAMEELLKYDSGVKAVVSSGYSTDQVMSRYRDFGFIGMVVKPYTLEELRCVLGSIE